MKTFEDALRAVITCSKRGPDSKQVNNMIDFAQEIMTSKLARDYIEGIPIAVLGDVDLKELENPRKKKAKRQAYVSIMSMCASAFAMGVMVGVEMEKQELEK